MDIYKYSVFLVLRCAKNKKHIFIYNHILYILLYLKYEEPKVLHTFDVFCEFEALRASN